MAYPYSSFDKGNRPLCVLLGQLLLVFAGNLWVDHLVPFDQGKVGPAFDSLHLRAKCEHTGVVGPHVVGVGQAESIHQSRVVMGRNFLWCPRCHLPKHPVA